MVDFSISIFISFLIDRGIFLSLVLGGSYRLSHRDDANFSSSQSQCSGSSHSKNGKTERLMGPIGFAFTNIITFTERMVFIISLTILLSCYLKELPIARKRNLQICKGRRRHKHTHTEGKQRVLSASSPGKSSSSVCKPRSEDTEINVRDREVSFQLLPAQLLDDVVTGAGELSVAFCLNPKEIVVVVVRTLLLLLVSARL